MKIYAVFTGSRDYQQYHKKFILDSLLSLDPNYDDVQMILGGARGLDTIMEELAQGYKKLNVSEVIEADWNKFGNQAGFLRNTQMLSRLAEKKMNGSKVVVVGFLIDELPCNGTWDTLRKAYDMKFPVLQFKTRILEGITKDFIQKSDPKELERLMLIAGKGSHGH